MADDKSIGVVNHYYSHLGVGTVLLNGQLKVGDQIKFVGNQTNFEQRVEEMQLDHKPIDTAEKDQDVGLKVVDKVRVGDKVYLI